MYPIGVVGADDRARDAIVGRITNRLSDHGAIATVEREAEADGPDSGRTGIDAQYTVSPTGVTVQGTDPSVRDLLEQLAPVYDYVIFNGFPEAEIPQLVIGGAAHEGVTMRAAPSAEDFELAGIEASIGATEPFETLPSLVRRAKDSAEAPKAGAIATFTGRVRAKEHDDDEVTERLEFEQYDEVADDRFDGIKNDLEARDGVYEALLHHRTGVIEYGEDIVFVVILAGHRDEAFAAVQDGINRLKAEVPLFKKEITVGDEFWAHQ